MLIICIVKLYKYLINVLVVGIVSIPLGDDILEEMDTLQKEYRFSDTVRPLSFTIVSFLSPNVALPTACREYALASFIHHC